MQVIGVPAEAAVSVPMSGRALIRQTVGEIDTEIEEINAVLAFKRKCIRARPGLLKTKAALLGRKGILAAKLHVAEVKDDAGGVRVTRGVQQRLPVEVVL